MRPKERKKKKEVHVQVKIMYSRGLEEFYRSQINKNKADTNRQPTRAYSGDQHHTVLGDQVTFNISPV